MPGDPRPGRLLGDVFTANLGNNQLSSLQARRGHLEQLDDVFEVTDRDGTPSEAQKTASSTHGRVMEMLSEHPCQGWLEGYVLTGRHGFFL